MNQIHFSVLTNDLHLWLLRGFCYLVNEYWRDVWFNVYGFSSPKFATPRNFKFVSLGTQKPADVWSNGLIDMLKKIQEPLVLLMLEDYWIYDPINIELIDQVSEFMLEEMNCGQNILRFDLSADRANTTGCCFYQSYKDLRIMESPSRAAYQMSFQAGIWNREEMLRHIIPNESPWDAEVNGSERLKKLNKLSPKVYGNVSPILKYQPVWRSKKKVFQVNKIPEHNIHFIRKMGWLDQRGV